MHKIKNKMMVVFLLAFSYGCFAAPENNTNTPQQESFLNSVEQNLVGFAKYTVDSFRYSIYQLGGKRFDTTRGIYIVDCSNFVDRLLQKSTPQAYSSLIDAAGVETPASGHYYKFFNGLSHNPNDYWNKIDDLDELQAGDILVFRYKNARGRETGGHVMIVMDKPKQEENTFFIRVADSAPSAHSEDTREPNTSGIGIGTLLLKANSKTGHPFAYAWGIDSYWNKNVKVAMARPAEKTQKTAKS